MPDNKIVIRNIPDQRIPVKNDVPVYLNSTIVKKIITSNGTYRAAEEKANGYDPVVVNVPTYEAENAELTAEVAELTETVAEKTAEIIQLEAEVVEAFDRGYEDGKNSVVDFARYAYQVQFRSSDWASENVTLNLDKANVLANLWSNFHDTVVKHLTVNCLSPITNMNRAFYLSPTDENAMEHITLNADTSQNTTFQQAFCYMKNLVTIDGTPLDCSSSTNNAMFGAVPMLKEIRFFKESIYTSLNISSPTNLSNETIQSVIDGLADLTGKTAQTVTFHKNVGAKLTDEQKATITAKNWTLVY